MIVKRSVYDYEDETIGANKQIFAVIGFRDERNEDETIKSFKVDHQSREEYEIIKTEFKETEEVYYVRRLDNDSPILPKYLEPGALWIPGFDMTSRMENGFSLSNSYEGLNEPILKELEILNNK